MSSLFMILSRIFCGWNISFGKMNVDILAVAYPSIIMSQGLGLRAGVIDGAISISAVQVLLLKLPDHSWSSKSLGLIVFF